MTGIGLADIVKQDIFSLTGLEHLPQEKKDELFQQAYETIMNRILLRIADQLEEGDLDKLKELFEAEDGAATTQFLSEHGIDLEQLATSETLAYKTEMASLTAALKSQSPQL